MTEVGDNKIFEKIAPVLCVGMYILYVCMSLTDYDRKRNNSELRIIYLTLYIHILYNNTIQYNSVKVMIVFVMFPFGQGDSH